MLGADNFMATFPNSHNIIDVVIDFQSANPPALNSFIYRDFKSNRSEELLHLLHYCDWSPVSCPDSGVDLRLEHLSQNIMDVVDQLAPLKQFKTLKRGLPPWVDAEIKDLYNQRDAVRKRYKRTQRSEGRVSVPRRDGRAAHATSERGVHPKQAIGYHGE